MIWKYFVVFILVNLTILANDCVPNTFTVLSYIIDKPVSNKVWRELLEVDKIPPTLNQSLNVWRHKVSNELTMVYCALYKSKDHVEEPIVFNTPYFWVGEMPIEMIIVSKEYNSHAAIVYFYPDDCLMYSTVMVKGKLKFLKELITYQEFYNRTFCVYRVNNPINKINNFKE